MPEEKQDAQQNSSSALANAIASSPEALEEVKQQIQETQTPPAQEGVTQEQETQQTEEEARVPYSRLKEVVDEKNWYKQQLERTIQAQQSQQQFQQPTQQPPQELGNTPEEREFWRLQRQIAREETERFHRERVQPVIDAGRMEIARIGTVLFRQQYPDVKSNSPEEVEIAQKISMGYPIDDAYKSVMWDRKVADAERQAKQNVKQKIEAKKQANVESSSIPSAAIPPIKEKLTVRQRIEKVAKEIGM